jgi:photosystem II stability/assembly factor-like uncharacterized protein
VPVEGESDFLAVDGMGSGALTLVNPQHAFLSSDQGKTWSPVAVPSYVTRMYSFSATPDSRLWLGTREGMLRSSDGGKTWDHLLGGLPPREVYGVRYDEATQRYLATAPYTHALFQSTDGGQNWTRTPDTGVSIRAAMTYQGHTLAASVYNGLLLEQGTPPAVAAESSPARSAAATTPQ